MAKITEQEKRNVFLSVYCAAISGLAQDVPEVFDEEVEDGFSEIATALAERGVDDYLTAHGETPPDRGDEEEEEEEEEPEPRPRRRRASR